MYEIETVQKLGLVLNIFLSICICNRTSQRGRTNSTIVHCHSMKIDRKQRSLESTICATYVLARISK